MALQRWPRGAAALADGDTVTIDVHCHCHRCVMDPLHRTVSTIGKVHHVLPRTFFLESFQAALAAQNQQQRTGQRHHDAARRGATRTMVYTAGS